jgi:hypothetical protein
MLTTEAGVPQVLTRQGDAWDDDTFQREWAEMVCTWQPTTEQLAQLDDVTIECWALLRPLDTRDGVFLLDLRRRNLFALEHGARQGWWRGWTNQGPWQPRRVRVQDFAGQTMAHVMAALRLFPSVGQARRAGWDGAVAPGLHRVGKTWVEVV